MKGRLVLEDGTVAHGDLFGATQEARRSFGEVVFNTAMTGYEEVVTDPSYAGQIVVMTAAEIGNVGWNREDMESIQPRLAGFVVRQLSPVVSNWRSERNLSDVLAEHNIVGLSGVDTRALTRRLRQFGSMRGLITGVPAAEISDQELVQEVKRSPGLEGRDLVAEVSTDKSFSWTEGSWRAPAVKARWHVVAYDFGMKTNILRQLVDVGCRVTVVGAQTSAAEAMAHKPDGIFLSNGPGDPAAVTYAAQACRTFLSQKVPLLGICLGHQILGLALGGKTYKLKFGHHGANQPVLNVQTGRVEITSQNHGFAVDVDSLKGRAELSHINLNDRTVEGMRVVDAPAFSVQYHPEASPGPHDSRYLFDDFVAQIARQR